MKSTIDSAGRLVIPSEIRKAARLKPGMPLEVRWRNGRIEIEPKPIEVKLVQQGPLLIAVPVDEVDPLLAETVDETLQELRPERGAMD